jgi:hypothetical protein
MTDRPLTGAARVLADQEAQRARIELLEAHVENLIQRVYALEGGDVRTPDDRRPHSRACGWELHEHGPACHRNCPTCHGARL